MKPLPGSVQAEKAKAEVISYYLIDIGVYYFTDNPSGYSYLGNNYIYFPLKIDNIAVSQIEPLEEISLTIGNANNFLSSLILNNSLREASVTIRSIYLDSSLNFIGAETLYYGKVSGRPSCTETEASINILPHRNPWTQRFPRRRITRHCNWKFTDTDCGYTGGATACDRTWANCTALANSHRFGGFRFIPEQGKVFVFGESVVRVKPSRGGR